jgi:nicotinamidase/pyrazinamidase
VIASKRKLLAVTGTLALVALAPRVLRAAPRYVIGPKDVLLVIDVQRCFTKGGTLAVANGDEVVPVINELATKFRNVVATQDWHTPKHVSFASQHTGKKPFDTTKLRYGNQMLWPDHCVQGTEDAGLHPDLKLPGAQLVIRKGYHNDVDSYSAFLEADRRTHTGLAGYLKERGINRVFVVGLATDFCVAWSAMDARKAGFKAVVLEDACRGIDAQGSLKAAWAAMAKAGVERAQSSEVTVKA